MNDPIYALVRLISTLLSLYSYAIIARALLSWFRLDPRNRLVTLLVKITNPILRPLGRIIPPIAGLDLTPVVAILIIQLVRGFIVDQLMPLSIGIY